MDSKNRCISQEANFTCPQLMPPPTADVKRAAPISQKTMVMNILSISHQVVPICETRNPHVHDHLGNNSPNGIGHSHEHQQQNSSKDTPARAKDEVARSRAKEGPESDKTPVDLPNQFTCETKLEGPNVSLETPYVIGNVPLRLRR